MKKDVSSISCATVQEQLAARREGWLNEAEAAAVDQHLAACAECRRQYELDEALCAELSALPAPEVRTPTWAQVQAVHAPVRPSLRRRVLLPAFGLAASLSLVWLLLRTPHPSAPPESAAMEAISAAAPETHMLLSIADPGSDPNRLIIAWASERGGR